MLFILHSTNANQSRRGAERVLKVKVRSGFIQEVLLQRTFRDYAQVGRSADVKCILLTEVLCHSLLFERWVVLINGDSLGHAGVFPLHPGSGSELVALP